LWIVRVYLYSGEEHRLTTSCSFGPKGHAVIKAALRTLHRESKDELDEDDDENILYTTLSQVVDKPKPWDTFDDASNLISPKKFLQFISVPHIAASLISEDLEISLHDAVEVLIDSRNFGCIFQADSPEKVDIIVTATNDPTQPPRHRKTVVKPTVKLVVSRQYPI
jgi:hypothetical protein